MSDLGRPSGYPPMAAAIALVRSGWGEMLLRPWADRLILRGMCDWYLPLSRAWAAAEANDAALFRAALPRAPLSDAALGRALARVAMRRRASDAAAQVWEAAFFGGEGVRADQLPVIERRRQEAAHAWMTSRSVFLPAHVRRPFPPLAWEMPGPGEVARRHGRRLADPAAAFPASRSRPSASRGFRSGAARISWLRLPGRVGGVADTAWARLLEPPQAEAAPTLIFLHGLAMETELLRPDVGLVDELVAHGVRVLRPEAPWHGRRRLPGHWGGEPMLARGPMGMLDLLQAWVGEAAAWIAWARRTGSGPVALGGVSMGALTAQLALGAAAHWPAESRPDAALLAATSASVRAVALDGSLTGRLGLAERLLEGGWGDEVLRRFEPLLDPPAAPPLPPERIVMLLGSADDLTPFGQGLALARRWQIPRANLFLRRQGHFTVSIGMMQQPAPLYRLVEVLRRAGREEGQRR